MGPYCANTLEINQLKDNNMYRFYSKTIYIECYLSSINSFFLVLLMLILIGRFCFDLKTYLVAQLQG